MEGHNSFSIGLNFPGKISFGGISSAKEHQMSGIDSYKENVFVFISERGGEERVIMSIKPANESLY